MSTHTCGTYREANGLLMTWSSIHYAWTGFCSHLPIPEPPTPDPVRDLTEPSDFRLGQRSPWCAVLPRYQTHLDPHWVTRTCSARTDHKNTVVTAKFAPLQLSVDKGVWRHYCNRSGDGIRGKRSGTEFRGWDADRSGVDIHVGQ